MNEEAAGLFSRIQPLSYDRLGFHSEEQADIRAGLRKASLPGLGRHPFQA